MGFGNHREHFETIEKAFATLGIKIDQSGKDISRLRIYSLDPEAHFNFEGVPFVQYASSVPVSKEASFENDINRDRAVVEAHVQIIIQNGWIAYTGSRIDIY